MPSPRTTRRPGNRRADATAKRLRRPGTRRLAIVTIAVASTAVGVTAAGAGPVRAEQPGVRSAPGAGVGAAAPESVGAAVANSETGPRVDQLVAASAAATLPPINAVSAGVPAPPALITLPDPASRSQFQAPVRRYGLSARFGEPGSWSSGHHTGLDFVAPEGRPVHAAKAGVVIWAAGGDAYGKQVQINHGGGITTLYAHLGTIRVRKGERVEGGQLIGTIGMTGHTTGPHCHFEVRVKDKPTNPARWLWPVTPRAARGLPR